MRKSGHKCFVGLMILSLCWSLVWCPVANAQAAVAAGRLSVAISEITVAKAARWGFAANDPRVTATKAGISAGLSVLAAGVGVVSWPVLLVAAGIGALVVGGVALSKDGKYSWEFGQSGITAKGSSAGVNPVGNISKDATLHGSGPIGPDTARVYYYSFAEKDSTGTYVLREFASSNMEQVGAMALGAMLKRSDFTIMSCSGRGCSFMYANGTYDNFVGIDIVAGFRVSSSSGSYDGRPPPGEVVIAPVLYAKPDEAVKAIPAAVAAQALSNQALAAAVNAAWKGASPAAQTGGLPWSASDPVTTAEVSDWASANPNSVPTVANFASAATVSVGSQSVIPIGSTYSLGGGGSSTLPSGGSSTAPSTGTTPAANTDAPTTPSDTTNPQVNLGPIPNISAPVLEDIPTAEKIIGPGFSLMPELKNFAVPAHSGVCPTAGFALYGKSYVVDAHCGLLEQNRSVIGALMVVIFTLVATYTVLRA